MPPLTLDGTTGVSAVQAGAVESGDLPAGSVIQVVHDETDVTVSTASLNTYIDYGLSVSITPFSADSKIIITAMLDTMYYDDDGDARIDARILRDGSPISTSTQFGRNRAQGDGGITLSKEKHPYIFVDEPSTTSSVTYTFEAALTQGVVLALQEASASPSVMTVMEIAG